MRSFFPCRPGFRLIAGFGSLLLIGLLSSCASPTRFTLLWHDQNYSGAPLQDILILGVADQPGKRRLFEDTFAQAFIGNGTNAVASYKVLPDGGKPDQSVIDRAIASRRTDAVLVTHLLGVEEKEIYHPPVSYTFPRHYRLGYYGHYVTVWDHIHQPGYYSRHQAVRLESNLYDSQTGKLIWSAQSETLDPESANVLIDSLSREVLRNLKQQKLIE
jgi:hypothetical protein